MSVMHVPEHWAFACPDCGMIGTHADTCGCFPGERVEHGNRVQVAPLSNHPGAVSADPTEAERFRESYEAATGGYLKVVHERDEARARVEQLEVALRKIAWLTPDGMNPEIIDYPNACQWAKHYAQEALDA